MNKFKCFFKICLTNFQLISGQVESFNQDLLAALTVGYRSKRKLGGGMDNVGGNSCFLGSTIQSLIYIPVVFNYLKSQYVLEHSSKCKDNNCIICPMVSTLNGTLNCVPKKFTSSIPKVPTLMSAIEPTLMFERLKVICNHIGDAQYDQHDAHELFM